MNELDPNLKRLLKWAQEAPRPEPEEAPFGFAARVLASRRPAEGLSLFYELQHIARALSWVSLVLIVCGAVVLLSRLSSPPAEEFTSALSFVASNLPQ